MLQCFFSVFKWVINRQLRCFALCCMCCVCVVLCCVALLSPPLHFLLRYCFVALLVVVASCLSKNRDPGNCYDFRLQV